MEAYSEYDEAPPMLHTYCKQIPAAQFQKQGADETEKALRNLMEYLEKNPQEYKKVLVRKKQEDAENAGIFSYVKCKVLATMKGPDYMQDEVTNEETLLKLGALQHEMTKVYNYTQEAYNSKKRFSRRLAAKKAKEANNRENSPPANFKKFAKSTKTRGSKRKTTTPPEPCRPPPPFPLPQPCQPPPTCRPSSFSSIMSSDDEVFSKLILLATPSRRPSIHRHDSTPSEDSSVPFAPPPPPPVWSSSKSRVLRERTNEVSLDSPMFESTPNKLSFNTKNPDTIASQTKFGSVTSLSSIASVHNELLSFDKTKLRSSSKQSEGPFKTPLCRKRIVSASVARASMTDICGISTVSAFNQQMVDKFRNARSPLASVNSPNVNSPASGFGSPTGFTP